MTDQNIMDGGQSSGTGGEPTQPVSQGAGDQQHSDAVTRLETVVKELQGQVRSLQGDKDRGVNEVKSQVKDLLKQLAWVEKAKARGDTPEEIEEQLELRELLAERRDRTGSPNASSATATGNRQQVTGPDATVVLSTLGLDAQDAQVVQIQAAGLTPADEALAFIQLAHQRKQALEQPAKPAQVMSGGGGSTVPNELGAKMAHLQTLLKNPTLNRIEIDKLQTELEKLIKAS